MSLLKVENLLKEYQLPKKDGWFGYDILRAVDGVSFSLEKGKTLGIVGESGSGKSTLARTLLRLEEPTAGQMWFEDTEITHMPEKLLREKRRYFQMVFQDS